VCNGRKKPLYLLEGPIERFRIAGGEGFEPSQADPEYSFALFPRLSTFFYICIILTP
jgi:hypothetical protein